jgi:hypothetical protein
MFDKKPKKVTKKNLNRVADFDEDKENVCPNQYDKENICPNKPLKLTFDSPFKFTGIA